MTTPIRRALTIGLIGLLYLTLAGAARPAAAAPPGQSADPYYLINLVNGVRAEYGLPPYQINPQLMAAAQAHSEWAASVGTHSHTGLGGSTPTHRAIAAGYGGGQSVRVSENIYWGSSATADSAVVWWRNSPIHFRGMTSTNYVEIGAGIAYGAGGGFFTLNFGSVGGASSAPPPASGQSSDSGTGVKPLPVYVFEPVEVAEPREDGSVVHVVGEGQNLSYISEAYEVAVSEILALNRLDDETLIHPGDELIIVPAPVEPVEEQEGPIVHTVQEGQTVFGIALSYGRTFDEILVLNGLAENDIIRPGDQLVIKPDPNATPVPRAPLYHTVTEGQTLLGIALRYGSDLETLLALNGLADSDIIRPGDKLLVRAGDPTPAPPATPTPDVTPTPQPTLTATPNASATQTARATARTDATAAAATVEAEDAALTPAPLRNRSLLIGAAVLVGLAGAGLVVAGIVMKPK